MNRLDLLFDVRCYRMSGIGRYIQGELSLLGFNLPGAGLAKAPARVSPKKVGLLCRSDEARFFMETGCAKVIEWNAPPFSLKEQFLSFSLLREALALTGAIWFPHWNVPLWFSKPKGVEMILTVHDLIPWTFPVYAKTLKSRLGWPIFLNAVQKADVIRCVSKATRETLLEKVPMARNKKVEVRYPNALPSFLKDPAFQRSLREKPWPEKWNFEKGQYALYVGNLKPHKGIDFLIDVWQEIQVQLPPMARLVLVGKSFGREIPERIQMTEKTVCLGEVTDEELWQLYVNAKVFCFPSFSEGYGIPPIEACAFGIPIIAATGIPSLEETLGLNIGIRFEKDLWIKSLIELFCSKQHPFKKGVLQIFKKSRSHGNSEHE